MKTLADLAAYVRCQARRNFADYGDRRPWMEDANRMQSQRRRVYREYGARWKLGTEPLTPGHYGRLEILPDGTPEYTPGQYAPTEIWHAVYVYLHATNNQ